MASQLWDAGSPTTRRSRSRVRNDQSDVARSSEGAPIPERGAKTQHFDLDRLLLSQEKLAERIGDFIRSSGSFAQQSLKTAGTKPPVLPDDMNNLLTTKFCTLAKLLDHLGKMNAEILVLARLRHAAVDVT